MNTNLKSQTSNPKQGSSNLQPPTSNLQPRAIAFILAAFFVLGIAYDVATPLFEKPDEIWHYPYVKYLADRQGLPVRDLARAQPLMRQESTQPPLYYVTAALATFWIEDDNWQDPVWLNPFWGYNAPGTVNDNKNRVLHTDREGFPYRGAVLAVHLARLVSVIWGGITVLATYLIALELFPKRHSFAAGAAALVAFNPQFIFIASAVSNDSTVSALCTLALWLMLRLLIRGISTHRLVWLGLIMGLALIAKASALALLPVAVAVIAIAAWSKARRPDVNVRAERAKPYGLRSSPERGFALSARGFSPVLCFPNNYTRPSAFSSSLPSQPQVNASLRGQILNRGPHSFGLGFQVRAIHLLVG